MIITINTPQPHEAPVAHDKEKGRVTAVLLCFDKNQNAKKNARQNANEFEKRICPATIWIIEIWLFSACYTMKSRNNGF